MSDRLRILPDTGDEDQPRPRVVLLGPAAAAELSEIRQQLARLVPANSICQVASIGELADHCTQDGLPDLIIVVQTWSDEFPFSVLLQSVPLIGPFTRLLCCYGPWCVGDGRSRQDWPLALRVPLEHFESAFLREWQQLLQPANSAPYLPWTAGRDEIFRVRDGAFTLKSNPLDAVSVRVVSPDRHLAELWQALLQRSGLSSTEQPGPVANQTILWDVDPWSDEIATAWAEERQRVPATGILALQGFVTPDETHRLITVGATRVLSKLLPLNELLTEISHACESRQAPE